MSPTDTPDDAATRRIDPSGQPTSRVSPPAGATRRMPPPAPADPASNAPTQVMGVPAGGAGHDDFDGNGDEGHSRGRTFVIGLIGAVIGFAAAFVVVALFTPGTETDVSDEQLAAMEAQLEDRDAQIADLEARVADAEALAGGREQDLDAQQRALDERAAALQEWSDALSDREAAVARREAAVAERESSTDDSPPADNDGLDLPSLDDEAVDTIVQRVLDGLRNLFN